MIVQHRPDPAPGDRDALVLVNQSWAGAPSTGAMAAIMAAILLAFAAAVFFILVQAAKKPDVGWLDTTMQFLAGVNWQQLASIHISLASLGQIAMLVAYFLFLDRAKKTERLILSAAGMRYISPLPRALKRLMPDWFLAWDEVRSIEAGVFPLPAQAGNHALVPDARRLVMFLVGAGPNGGASRHRIFPLLWARPEAASARWFRLAWDRLRRRQPEPNFAQVLAESEVGRYLAAHQPHLAIRWSETVSPYPPMNALERDRHGKAALVLLALLMLYAMLDFVLGPESYVASPAGQEYLFAGAGIGAALLSGLWLSRSALTFAETAGLAVLLGAATAVAMIPGALRINQFIGGNELVSYDCRVLKAGDRIVLQPVTPGIPDVAYFSSNDYWNKFGTDARYPVRIRKGILGFYQFDSADILRRMARDP